MRTQRIFLAGMILAQAGVYAVLSDGYLYAAGIAAAAVPGASGLVRVPLGRDRRILLLLFLALGFTLAWYFGLGAENPRVTQVSWRGLPMREFAQFLLLAQVVQLFLRPRGGERAGFSQSYALAAGAGMCAMCFFPLTGRQQALVVLMAGAFALCYALFSAAGNRGAAGQNAAGRSAVLVGFLAVVLASGTGASLYAEENFYKLDNLFGKLIVPPAPPVTAGLSKRATLESVRFVQSEHDRSVLVRVESAEAPGYLRARAYDTFTGRVWELPGERELRGGRPHTTGTGTETRFTVRVAAGKPDAALDIWPASRDDIALLPLETVTLAAETEEIEVDPAGTVFFGDGGGLLHYRALTGTPASDAQHADVLARYTQTPEGLDPRIGALAQRLFNDCATFEQKAGAVLGHFDREFAYANSIQVPPDADPLAYFLCERRAAHCEYFASGATVLLRLAGVPCRYVTGVVVMERQALGGYWVGRGRNAHAWVEAWHPKKGWQLLEPTPPDGRVDGGASGMAAALWDLLKLHFQKLRVLLRRGFREGLGAAGGMLAQALLHTWPGRLAMAGLGLAALWRALRRWRRRTRHPKRTAYPELRRLLRRADRQMRRAGFRRKDDETACEFARRLESRAENTPELRNAAAWYRAYATTRFRNPGDPDAVAALKQAAGCGTSRGA